MNVFKNVKTIGLKMSFEGNGCVNFDSNEQKYVINKKGMGSVSNDNNMLAKKNFYSEVDEEGNTINYFKHKVSSECIRHEIFKETMPFHNPNIAGIPYVLYSAIAMPDYVMRGYLFTRDGNNGLKKKSAITISDAEETGKSNTVVTEIHTRTGFKETGTETKECKDTTLYNIESVGVKNYTSEGFINLSELQFIPDDPVFDRMSLCVEDGSLEEKLYLNAIKSNMVNFEPKMKYYSKKGCYGKDSVAERGLLLNKESVNMMVNRTLKNILAINILRRNAFFKLSSLEAIVNMADGTSETITITNENVDDFTFGYAQEYTEADENTVKESVALINKYIDNKNAAKANKKAKKSANKETTEE